MHVSFAASSDLLRDVEVKPWLNPKQTAQALPVTEKTYLFQKLYIYI